MKKLSILALAAIVFAACGGNKSTSNAEEADSLKSFEQEQIEASIKMHFDSIAAEFSKIDQPNFVKETENGIALTKEEKQVKPTYLLAPSVADEATTLAEKYRVLAALNVDKRIANLYEMPVEDFDKAITKLAADIDDPSFKDIEDKGSIFETSSAALVEQLYIVSQNKDKFLSTFTDETAANVTFRIILILDATNRLSQYDPEIAPVAAAMTPLEHLNATSVNELKAQMDDMKAEIEAARKALVK